MREKRSLPKKGHWILVIHHTGTRLKLLSTSAEIIFSISSLINISWVVKNLLASWSQLTSLLHLRQRHQEPMGDHFWDFKGNSLEMDSKRIITLQSMVYGANLILGKFTGSTFEGFFWKTLPENMHGVFDFVFQWSMDCSKLIFSIIWFSIHLQELFEYSRIHGLIEIRGGRVEEIFHYTLRLLEKSIAFIIFHANINRKMRSLEKMKKIEKLVNNRWL